MKTVKSAVIFYTAFILVMTFSIAGINGVRVVQNNCGDDVQVLSSVSDKSAYMHNIARRTQTDPHANMLVMAFAIFLFIASVTQRSAFNHAFPDIIGSLWQIYAKIAIPARAAPLL